VRRFLLPLLCFPAACALAGAAGTLDAATCREAVEADWLLQDKVRTGKRMTTPRRTNVTTKQDALGAVDGVKDGKWGFHTLNEPNPWWHVDLGEKTPLDRVALLLRLAGLLAERD